MYGGLDDIWRSEIFDLDNHNGGPPWFRMWIFLDFQESPQTSVNFFRRAIGEAPKKCKNIKCFRGQECFRHLRRQKGLIFIYKFFWINMNEFSKPYITNFLLLIAFLSTYFPKRCKIFMKGS